MSRQGRITASRCADFMARGRGKDVEFGETAKTYAKELALARLGVDVESTVTTWQMEWGLEYEPFAREIYEQSRNVEVRMPEFITMGDDAGCTPDGVIGDGLLEIKCPQWKAHVDYLLNGPPKQYIYQMQFQMMVSGAEWCDFMTFHPEFPDNLKAKVFRVERDGVFITQMVNRIAKFVPIIESYVEQLNKI